MQTQFGSSAGAYVTSAGHAGGDDLQTLLGWGRARHARHVLDVATGGGHTALAFASLGARVVAVDLTEPMLHAARDFLRDRGAADVAFVAGDVEALPFREGRFEIVTCRIAVPDKSNSHRSSLPERLDVTRISVPSGEKLGELYE